MQNTISTERLLLQQLALNDAAFILELVNTPSWIQYIGQRHVYNLTDAASYIEKIMSNPNITYWVVRVQRTQIPVGVISFIQRDYLDHPDIGFALLPAHAKNGYALEAAKAVLAHEGANQIQILATTLRSNMSSIRLLEKLGLRFEKEIEVGGEQLLLYKMVMRTA